jgi:two-component system OmpR family response regulator
MKVLVIEDDSDVAAFVVKGLREAGHTVEHAATGPDGLFLAVTESYDAMIVDRMLPGVPGLTIVETVRSAGKTTPVIFLTALGDVSERIRGLRAGGDDYLTKPFALGELMARLDALLRRASPAIVSTTLAVGDLVLDRLARVVTRGGQVIDLQPQEYRLIEYLMRHAGQVVTRTMLLENVWDYHFDPHTSVIDVHISKLRQKIDRNFPQALIHTIRGAGYVIRAE